MKKLVIPMTVLLLTTVVTGCTAKTTTNNVNPDKDWLYCVSNSQSYHFKPNTYILKYVNGISYVLSKNTNAASPLADCRVIDTR